MHHRHGPVPKQGLPHQNVSASLFLCRVQADALPHFRRSGARWHCICRRHAMPSFPAPSGCSCATVRDGKEDRWLTLEKWYLAQLHGAKSACNEMTDWQIVYLLDLLATNRVISFCQPHWWIDESPRPKWFLSGSKREEWPVFGFGSHSPERFKSLCQNCTQVHSWGHEVKVIFHFPGNQKIV